MFGFNSGHKISFFAKRVTYMLPIFIFERRGWDRKLLKFPSDSFVRNACITGVQPSYLFFVNFNKYLPTSLVDSLRKTSDIFFISLYVAIILLTAGQSVG